MRPWLSYSYTDAKFVDFKSDNNNNGRRSTSPGTRCRAFRATCSAAGLDLGTQQGCILTSTFLHIDKVPVTFDNSTYVRGYDLLGAKLGYRAAGRRSTGCSRRLQAATTCSATRYYSFLFVGPNIQGLGDSRRTAARATATSFRDRMVQQDMEA